MSVKSKKYNIYLLPFDTIPATKNKSAETLRTWLVVFAHRRDFAAFPQLLLVESLKRKGKENDFLFDRHQKRLNTAATHTS